MTYQEYVASDPERPLPMGKVKLRPDDCQAIYPQFKKGFYTVVLNFNNTKLRYLKTPESALLWTTDEDGNKRAASVFSINI